MTSNTQVPFAWVEDARTEIRLRMRRNALSDVNKSFITDDDLTEIWKLATQSYANLARRDIPCVAQCDEESFSKSWMRIISILVWIKWLDPHQGRQRQEDLERIYQLTWERRCANETPRILPPTQFRGSFLPFSDEELSRTIFPSNEEDAANFKMAQFSFLPITIQEDKHQEYEQDLIRLPFISETEENTTGAYGTVTKVSIASKHYRLAQPSPAGQFNVKEYAVARKRFEAPANFSRELKALTILQSNSLRQERIMKCLGSVRIGQQCNLFFNWADSDLERFLAGETFRLNQALEDKATPNLLLNELYGLAEALEFLHTQIKVNGKSVQFCHMDLKPNNILVMQDYELPLGKWKIADFGISNYEVDSDVVLSTRDLIARTTKKSPNRAFGLEDVRYAGPYQPPEAEKEVSKERIKASQVAPGCKSDIWSFGCIILTVLIFAVGGPIYNQELDKQLDYNKVDCDGFHRQGRFYRNIEGEFKLSPQLCSWFQPLVQSRGGWLFDVWKCVASRMLNMVAENRISSRELSSELYHLAQRAPKMNQWGSAPPLIEAPSSVARNLPVPAQNQTDYLYSAINKSMPLRRRPVPQRDNLLQVPSPSIPDVILEDSHSEPPLSPQPTPPLQRPIPTDDLNVSARTTAVSAFRSQESPNKSRDTLSRASSDLSNDLHDENNVQLSADGQRIVFWNKSRAKVFNCSNEPDALFTPDMARSFPPTGSIPWDQVIISGSFLVLRKHSSSPKSDDMLELRSLDLKTPQPTQNWNKLVKVREILDLDLSPSGSLAFRFEKAVKGFRPDGILVLNYSHITAGNVIASKFGRTGSTVVVVLWEDWLVFQVDAQGFYSQRAAGRHAFVRPDHGGFKPQIIPFWHGTSFGLHDLGAPGRFALVQDHGAGTLQGPAVQISLQVKPQVITISPDNTRLIIVSVEHEKILGHRKYFLACHEILRTHPGSRGPLEKGRQTMKKVLQFKYQKGLKISLTAFLLVDGLVALIAASDGHIESVALI